MLCWKIKYDDDDDDDDDVLCLTNKECCFLATNTWKSVVVNYQ